MPHPTRQQIIHALNNCLTTFANSLAAYLAEADPYVTDNDKDALAAITEAAAADKRFEQAISEMILELDGIPQIGSVNPQLSEMNYLSFPYLLDVMIKYKRDEVARYKPLPGLVPNYPDVKKLFSVILKAHQEHLAKMEAVRKSRYKTDDPEPEAPAEENADESAESPEPEGATAESDAS